MAASVQVLCPNGRRQNVKVNPNTKLLQILEEVCKRQGIEPPEDYNLVHARTVLDLSLSLRFSNVPNNAKLELVKSTLSRVEQNVTIALQLDSAQRLMDNFSPSVSLWYILQHFENKNSEYKGILTRVDTSQSPALHPVCIYMREEVIGEPALKAMTLRKLALTSGKAIIRLLHRPVEDNVIGEIVNKVEKEKQKQEKLEEMALKKKSEQIGFMPSDTSPVSTVEETCGANEMDTHEATSAISDDSSAWSGGRTVPGDALSQDTSSGLPMDEGVHDTSLISDSAPLKPHSHHKKPKCDDQGQSTSAASIPAIEQLRNMNIPGVQIFTPDDFSDLSPTEQMIARRLAQRILPQLQVANTPGGITSNTNQGREQIPPQQSFADFKFPESTRGQDLTGGNSSESGAKECEPCERDVIVYSMDESLSQTPSQDNALSDDFFEVTQADVRLLYRDLQNSVQQMEDQPMMTKAMRQAQMESAFDEYERIVIRVQFPDHLVLQACFRPREKVAVLYSIVKDHLQNKQDKFYLYTSPPKNILKNKETSLAVNYLAPAAVVYFGSETAKDHYLSAAVRDSVQRRIQAEALVTKVLQRSDDTSESSSSTQSGSTPQVGPSGTSRHTGVTSSAPTVLPSGTKVPKWMKLSKK